MNYDEKLVHELSEVIVGAILIVISFSYIGFNSIEKIVISTVVIFIGAYYIFKANRSYKRRKDNHE
jgi:hypothetical protein